MNKLTILYLLKQGVLNYQLNHHIISTLIILLFKIKLKQVKMYTKSALKILEQTSRTFYIPVIKLPENIQQAVASAYLCLRAIDQVQDHPKLSNQIKTKILREISYTIQKYKPSSKMDDMKFNWYGQEKILPQVTLRLAEWIYYCPQSIRARVADSTSSMADRMAFWAQRNWKIEDQSDLDAYTYSVAGSVGLILCELWDWHQGTKTDRDLAIGYGRGLQTVNILRNSKQDEQRGVTFYPPNWKQQDMIKYSRSNLNLAQQYMKSLKPGTAAFIFCQIPLALALATINIIEHGLPKLTRQQVLQICKVK